jgi:surface antigen
MRQSWTMLAVVLAMGGMATTAAAQMQSYLPRRLTGGDMTILRAEAAKLGPQGPMEQSWHNRKSGNSGVVTFLSADTEHGRSCRLFRYTFRTGTPQDGTPYKLNWCRTSAGNWAIVS